ncbi:hypothetical protein ES332_A07G213400v1 [Gossypium tomentosum]|uniref:Protein kinase domain-containing protein n=1 Tax=Gossypium tomentosum TaxID=34277 RepID=A0A5D2PV80_GOSTO|nr:hypothetical protein ES332_A07G213400v1 [Gossypium tomentosum]
MEIPTKTPTLSLQNSFPCLFFFFFFFSQYLVAPVTADFVVTPYYPIENIAIDCSSPSTKASSLDSRSWLGDGNGKFSLIEPQNNKNKSSTTVAVSPLPSSVETVPYSTARLSKSQFTYSIPLTAGVQSLYFYPMSYPDFERPSINAFFSVKAGLVTLLSNFSALLHARGEVTVVKEFCVNVDEGQRLNLTFVPTPDITDSYAFVNGIEVVSMPINLYYTPEINDDGVPFVGQAQGSLYTLGNNTALEKMYRINVGGSEISPGEDNGVFRGYALPVNESINLTFSSIPSYSAPREVYITARTMGMNMAQNENYQLTWEFPVDSGFNYFVRLHFCEFQIEITTQGDRVFEILLANKTAETQADVISWSGANGIPVYRDYVVSIGKQGNQKQRNLSIALHPSPAWRTLYSDAIWNGLEIFKLSNGFSLSGPSFDLTSGRNIHNRKSPVVQITKKRTIIAAVVAPISGFITIKTATNNFNKSFIIGRGGFGNVYKGFTNASSTPVAIKRLNPSSQQGVLEFRTEIEMLSKLRHQNLVSLIGYCEDKEEMILVYDYMVHGTLRDHLYNTNNLPLQWEQRLKMGPNHTIIHRDVKTTNILINEKWIAKVSDFGLSKMNDLSNTYISTAVKGSIGYLDPEYYRLQKITEKSDVYSFGVVLCEVLCARAPIDRAAEDHMQISLAEWAQHCYNNGTLDPVIDTRLQGKIKLASLLKFGEVAISCLASEGIKRPTMSEVVYGLELALKLQGSEMNGNDENHANDSSTIDYHVLFTSEFISFILPTSISFHGLTFGDKSCRENLWSVISLL